MVRPLYEDRGSPMKGTTQFTIVMGDFNTKVGEKQIEERPVGHSGIGSRNSRGDSLVEFAQRNNPRIMNILFWKRNKEWTWKGPYGRTKSD